MFFAIISSTAFTHIHSQASMKRYESLLTSFASRINAIHQSLAGDAALLSSSVESDALAHSVSSRFSASIPSADLLMDVANYNALHRFFHRFMLLHAPSVSNFNLLSHTEFVYFCLFFQSSLISFHSIPCFSKLDTIETATEAYKLASSTSTSFASAPLTCSNTPGGVCVVFGDVGFSNLDKSKCN